MNQNLMESFCKLIEEKGYKCTKQRKIILNIMLENIDKHLSVEEIYEFVKEKDNKIGLATVYRTLLLMDELGIVSKLNKKSQFDKYELNINNKNCKRPHLICMKCDKIVEINMDFLSDDFVDKIVKKYDFKVKDMRISLYGVCNECLKKQIQAQ